MKILFLSELFHPHIGGCEIRFYELGKRLVKKGHAVDVLTVRYDPSLPKTEKIDGVTVHRISDTFNYVVESGWRSLKGVLKYSFNTFLKSFLKEIDFDIIFSNEWPITHSLLITPFYREIFVQDWSEVWTRKILHLEFLLARLANHNLHRALHVSQKNRPNYKSFHKSPKTNTNIKTNTCWNWPSTTLLQKQI